MIATIPFLVDKFKKFLVLYTSNSLMERDEQHLLEIGKFLSINIDIRVQTQPVITEDDSTLVIVDEADDIFLDKRTTLDARYCIGLTATPLSDQEGVEKEFVVSHLGFA